MIETMPAHPRAPQLGELERLIMNTLWDNAAATTKDVESRHVDTENVAPHGVESRDLGPAGTSVREVLELLPPERGPAYTTVMTVLDRLTKKGLLSRERDGKAWRYLPVGTRASLTAEALRATLDQVADRQAALLHFLDASSADELDDLRAALAEVERRRT